MPKNQRILHIRFDTLSQTSQYYNNHPSIVALGDEWGVIRIMYGEGLHNDCYVFAAISKLNNSEVDIPRACLPIDNCTEDQADQVHELYVELQADGPAPARARYANHIVVKSYPEVRRHFENRIKNFEKDGWEIFRVNYGDHLPDPLYRDCHIFLAFRVCDFLESDEPRVVLRKVNCTEKEDEEIQQIEYLDPFSGDPFTLSPDLPESKDKIN